MAAIVTSMSKNGHRRRRKRYFLHFFVLLPILLMLVLASNMLQDLLWGSEANHRDSSSGQSLLSYIIAEETVDTVQKESPLDGKMKNIPLHATNSTIKIYRHILYYTKYWWTKDDFDFGEGHEPFQLTGCPVHDCVVTAYRDYLPKMNQYDAIFFHGHSDPVSQEDLDDIASWRTPDQLFVIMPMESPVFGSSIPARKDPFIPDEAFDNFFNRTMSYRWDSDYPRPYGWIVPKDSTEFYAHLIEWMPYDRGAFLDTLPTKPASFHALAKRPKMVAWIASNCEAHNGREKYVEELKKYIQVDVFGKCGEVECSQLYDAHGLDSCTESVRHNYLFYLSFENSFCMDYVTEKFFHRLGSNVLVTLGQANYSAIAPPHSYLNALDYTPKELAAELFRLSRDPTEYLSYYWWMDHYRVIPHDSTKGIRNKAFGRAMCHLCEELRDKDYSPRSYEDLQGWWNEPAECNDVMDIFEEKLSS